MAMDIALEAQRNTILQESVCLLWQVVREKGGGERRRGGGLTLRMERMRAFLKMVTPSLMAEKRHARGLSRSPCHVSVSHTSHDSTTH